MEKYIDLLKNADLFDGMDENEIWNILDCLSAKPQHFQKGEYIFHTGEYISTVAFLLEGYVHIQREDYWGNLSILSKIFPGDIFGEAYAIPESDPMLNSALATTDCAIVFFDIRHVFTVCTSACCFHTLLIKNLFKIISLKNRSLAQKLSHMSQRTIREKLLSYLSEQSVKTNSPSFDIPFTRQQLADFLSVDRSAMSKELCKMRDEGILLFNKNHFRLQCD